jgi:hypothetical protein
VTNKLGTIVEKGTGVRGIRVSVIEVKLINNKEAKVKGACFSIFGTIRDQVYLVIKENHKWIVKDANNIPDI